MEMTREQILSSKQWTWRIIYPFAVSLLTAVLVFICGLYPNKYILLSMMSAMRSVDFVIALGAVSGVLYFIGVVMAPQSITKRAVIIAGLTLIFWFGYLTSLFERWDIRAELAGAMAAITAIAVLIIHFSPINQFIPQKEPGMEYVEDESSPTGNIVASILLGFLLLFSSSEVLAQGFVASNKDWSIAILSDPNPKALAEKVVEWRMKNPGILLSVEHTSKPYSNSTSGPSGENAYIYFIPCPEARKYRTDAC